MRFLVLDFFRYHNNNLRDTTSWECIVQNDCARPCLKELQSFPTWKANCMSTQYTVSWCTFHFSLLRCKKWSVKSNFFNLGVFFQWGFSDIKNTVCLSLLGFYPPAINLEIVMVWIDSTSTEINAPEEIVREQYKWRITRISSWMTLQSSKIKNFCPDGSGQCLRLLPSRSAIHHQTNENTQLCYENNLSISRIRSPHLLLEMILHVDEKCSFFPPRCKLDPCSWFSIDRFSFENRKSPWT